MEKQSPTLERFKEYRSRFGATAGRFGVRRFIAAFGSGAERVLGHALRAEAKR